MSAPQPRIGSRRGVLGHFSELGPGRLDLHGEALAGFDDDAGDPGDGATPPGQLLRDGQQRVQPVYGSGRRVRLRVEVAQVPAQRLTAQLRSATRSSR
ncbi:hypothetical protein [Dactylosporangium darangshiense]|uniref:hypothetical protein n=1 Tax=Dactylosporangium darangshiense TaxID=579108 RepID=UPI0031EC4A7F